MDRVRSLLLLAAIWSNVASAVEIADFRFGLVCPNAQSRVGWVCHETKDIHITGQGECVYDGKRMPCTWYGFSFTYTNARARDVFQCTLTSSLPVTRGNPEGVVSKRAKEAKYEFTVPEGSGTFFNPQYSVFSVAREGQEVTQEHTECKVDGKPAFSFDANFIHPRPWGLIP